jgi:hypothetical protein
VRRDELVLLTLIILERQNGSSQAEALDPLDEACPVGGAAELAVGGNLESDFLLHFDGVADALILHSGEFDVVDLMSMVAAKRLAERGRPQQAADMIGAKRWAAGGETHQDMFRLGGRR